MSVIFTCLKTDSETDERYIYMFRDSEIDERYIYMFRDRRASYFLV